MWRRSSRSPGRSSTLSERAVHSRRSGWAAAAVILLLLEVLSFRITTNGWATSEWTRQTTRFALGFPARSLSFTNESVEGALPLEYIYPEKDEWQAGFRIRWIELGLDVATAGLVLVLSRSLLRIDAPSIASGMSLGFVLGIASNGLHCIRLKFQGEFSWLDLLVFLLVGTTWRVWGSRRAERPMRARFVRAIGCALLLEPSMRFADLLWQPPISGSIRWTQVIGASLASAVILLATSSALIWVMRSASARLRAAS